MVRKGLICVCIAILGCALSFAADNEVHGRVLDASGALVPGADVTLTGDGGVTFHVTSDAAGKFSTPALPLGNYTVTVSASGFAPYHKENLRLTTGQELNLEVTLSVSSAGQSVVVYGGGLGGATPQPSQSDVFNSDQSLRVIDRQQMDIAGPVAGAAQILATAPGANVTGYGNTGATKYTIMLNGIDQGWGGYGGYTGGGSLSITFDGVPIADPATGLWQSPTIPETAMIQNVDVTYGPGAAADRWYTNIGGQVEFTPVEPTVKPHIAVITSYGSFFQKDMVVNATSGIFHGWSTAASVGGDTGNDFRRSPDGFKNPAKDIAVYLKTVHAFEEGSFELGGYYAHSGGYRSQVIPTTANPGITIDGQAGSLEYSQPTSGFYSTLSYVDYNKYDTNDMALIYSRQSVRLDPTLTFDNLGWFMRIDRTHHRINDVYSPGPQLMEWNDPHTDTVGDRVGFSKVLPMNTIKGGGYYIHALYNSRNNFFNPANGGSKTTANIGGKVRSGYFDQDDFTIFLQDDFRPTSKLHITPGIRYSGFQVNYSNHALQDFKFASGVVLHNSDCANFYQQTTPAGANTKDQGANCGAQENRSGMEPSADVEYLVMPWLTIYGGYQEALKSPQMGGGGGLFQSVDPSSYHLARQRFYQGGFKIHNEGTGVLNSFLFGANFYHQRYSNQEIDVSLANGDTIANSGTSSYHGVNLYVDDDPIAKLHIFANASVERAIYTNYVTGAPTVALGGTAYNGLPVAYVPNSTLNAGAYYQFNVMKVPVQPMFSLQYTGRQAIFDNSVALPSSKTMSNFTTANAGFKVPLKHTDIGLNALNIFRNRYNEYEYVSSGGYFGTPTGGYILAYPGAPASVYGTITAHF